MTEWLAESPYDGTSLSLEAARVLYRGRTDYQEVVIFESRAYGRVLMLDRVFQTSERDEFVYHEMLVHVPMLAHGDARRVLIIGGGDGGTLREVLKHDVERATMVEIDAGVVELCRTHLPALSDGAFDDPRTELVIGNGVRFVHECAERYDLIIVDSTDPYPAGPGTTLFTEDFYATCRRRVTEPGVVVSQHGTPFAHPDALATARSRLAAFEDVAFYLAAVPLYNPGYTALGWAATDASLRATSVKTLSQRLGSAELETRFYSPDFHHAAFSLPRMFAEAASLPGA